MNRSILTCAALCVSLACGSALAQADKAAAAKTAARKPAKGMAAKPVVPEAPLAPANDEQKAAAALALMGDYECELDQSIVVAMSPRSEGYVDVKYKAQTWTLKPILSSTGALRLEDVKGRILMIQIANKSMVLDTQVGQRLVDGCLHEKQKEFARTMDASGSSLNIRP